jgi:two-component system chemotaxis response regulator CheB
VRPVRVLIVDDSAMMRRLIAATLREDPDLEVVGQASNALEAREAIKALNPDVVTLDVEMPSMSGLEFLEKIMRLRPTPVVMVSSTTTSGADATIRALEIGAVDCVPKPSPEDAHAFGELAAKVKMAARARLAHGPRLGRPQASPPSPPVSSDRHLVAIGASTGGVEALVAILSGFPERCPPTVVTQHMPAQFTQGFARRLDRLCAPRVCEAVDGAPLVPGCVHVAPGGVAHLEVSGSSELRCRLRPGEPVNGHRPSVDVLFGSVARAVGDRAVGVILTGMGRDGAAGLLAMRRAGARTFGQDEATCVVYGMPKAALELDAVDEQLPLSDIGSRILSLTSSIHQR